MKIYLDSLNRLNDKRLLTAEMIQKAIERKWITEEEAQTIILK